MRRWDRLVDEYLVACRARGLAEGSVDRIERELVRWGAWMKRRRPRPRLEDVEVERGVGPEISAVRLEKDARWRNEYFDHGVTVDDRFIQPSAERAVPACARSPAARRVDPGQSPQAVRAADPRR